MVPPPPGPNMNNTRPGPPMGPPQMGNSRPPMGPVMSGSLKPGPPPMSGQQNQNSLTAAPPLGRRISNSGPAMNGPPMGGPSTGGPPVQGYPMTGTSPIGQQNGSPRRLSGS
ncbi:hypothetical protein HK101_006042, partial [Irineochytrium annulatum]